MNILIQHGEVIDPCRGFQQVADVAIQLGHVLSIGSVAKDFQPDQVIDARGCWVMPGLVDLCAR